MKLVFYVWVMSFLIGFFAACDKSPETIKADQKRLDECKAKCTEVGRKVNEFWLGFDGNCTCEEK